MAVYNGNMSINYGGASNSIAGDLLQAFGFQNDEIKNTEFRRQQIAQDNQLQRDLFYMSKANEFNAQEAQKNRDWQTQMSNTEISRRVADLRSVGLNPILAINQGGASTPSGATASSSGYRSSGSGYSSGGSSNIIGTIINALAGIYGTASTNATKLALADVYHGNALKQMQYGSKLKMAETKYASQFKGRSSYLDSFNKQWIENWKKNK